jgi:multidrug efflux pump subunit AcrA (membrane-fusion protein)
MRRAGGAESSQITPSTCLAPLMTTAPPLANSAVSFTATTGGGAHLASSSTPGTVSPGGPPDAQLVADTKHEIRVLVQEVAQLAQQDLPADEFYSAFLTRVVSAMGAVGGAVWALAESGKLRCAFQIGLAAAGLDATPEQRKQHGRLLHKTMSGNQAILVPPRSGTESPDEPGNPSELLLVLAPLIVDGQAQAVIEIFQRPGSGPTTQRGYLRFLVQMSDLACDFLKNRRLRQLGENQNLWRSVEQFVQAIHSSLDVPAVGMAIVNEGRRLVGCDRVSLAIRYGGQCRIEAVSGLDSIERRAAEVKQLAALATAVLKTGEPLWHGEGSEPLPPQIEQPLSQYVDRSHARLIAVLPLWAETRRQDDGAPAVPAARPLGAIIIEQLRDARDSETLRTKGQLVAQHGGQALARAIDHSSLFLLPVWKALGKATWMFRGRSLPKTLLALVLLCGAIAALALVKTDFEVAARGKLQPQERREVFAQIDGVVARVPVRHGQDVAAGELLAELTNTNLELDLAALIGRQTTNQEQLAALQRALLDNSSATGARLSPADESRLAGELLQLRQEAENIQRELALFHEKQRQLVVLAPHAGQVVTWKVEELLAGRPVVRGQALMTLARPDGPWELELYVPERRLAHLQAAAQLPADSSARAPLDVVFTLSSHPGSQFHGRIVEMEQVAEVRGDEGNTVLVRVAIERDQLPTLHDQTTVTAKLYCGRTSIGYAWFCDLIETVQAKVLFWLPA